MVTPFVQLGTTKTVVKSVTDETVDGYEAAYSCYFASGSNRSAPAVSAPASVKEDEEDC